MLVIELAFGSFDLQGINLLLLLPICLLDRVLTNVLAFAIYSLFLGSTKLVKLRFTEDSATVDVFPAFTLANDTICVQASRASLILFR